MFTRGSVSHGEVNDIRNNAEGARECRYRCTRDPIWLQVRADMATSKWAVMGLEYLNLVT